jgi:hypothetical protein
MTYEILGFLVALFLLLTVTTVALVIRQSCSKKRDYMRSDMTAKVHALRSGAAADTDTDGELSRAIHIHGDGHTIILARVVIADHMHMAAATEEEWRQAAAG